MAPTADIITSICHEMLEEYMNGRSADREEIAGQVEIAREGMRRYAPALH